MAVTIVSSSQAGISRVQKPTAIAIMIETIHGDSPVETPVCVSAVVLVRILVLVICVLRIRVRVRVRVR
jgi:hypothetical protein